MPTTKYLEEYATEENLPMHNVLCWRCDGNGVHDCFEGGFSSSDEFAQDPDFHEDYMSGAYDTACSECGGRRVLRVPDEERMTPEQLEDWEATQRAAWECEAEAAAEREMGA